MDCGFSPLFLVIDLRNARLHEVVYPARSRVGMLETSLEKRKKTLKQRRNDSRVKELSSSILARFRVFCGY